MNGRIEINPSVMQGKPVIRGTRIPVELLLRKLAEGATVEDLLDAYPRLTQDDVQTCASPHLNKHPCVSISSFSCKYGLRAVRGATPQDFGDSALSSDPI